MCVNLTLINLQNRFISIKEKKTNSAMTRFSINSFNLITVLIATVLCLSRTEAQGLKYSESESHQFSPSCISAINAEVETALSNGAFPGCVISIVRGGEIVFLKSYGNRQVYPDTIPMTTNTIFDIASLSKCVGTTLCAMQLVENGTLGTKDPVKKYIEGFMPWKDPKTGKSDDITIQDLMTHSSGLPAYINENTHYDEYGTTRDSLLEYIRRDAVRGFRPGTKYRYSCLNYITLQKIIETLSGMRLEEYAEQNIYKPLGLSHTGYSPAIRHQDFMTDIAPTLLMDDGKCLVGTVHDPIARIINGGNSGNAGLFTDAEDLSTICAAIMNGGEINGQRILKSETIKLMATIPADNNPSIGRTLGWDRCSRSSKICGETMDKSSVLCHTGYTGTSVVMDLRTKTAIIILSNRVHPNDTGKSALADFRAGISDIVAGKIMNQAK